MLLAAEAGGFPRFFLKELTVVFWSSFSAADVRAYRSHSLRMMKVGGSQVVRSEMRFGNESRVHCRDIVLRKSAELMVIFVAVLRENLAPNRF